jgi:hypothetical protein
MSITSLEADSKECSEICGMHDWGILFVISVSVTQGKRPLGRPRRRWVEFLEIGWGGVHSIGLAQDRDKWRALVNAVRFHKMPGNYRVATRSSSSQFDKVARA